MSLSTDRIKTRRSVVTAQWSAKTIRSVEKHARPQAANMSLELQGSNTSGTHPRERMGLNSNKMISDHLLACTTKMFEILNDGFYPIGICLSAYCTSKASNSHPRGCPTIHLSKSFSTIFCFPF